MRLALEGDTLSGGDAVDRQALRVTPVVLILPESIVFQLQPNFVLARQFDHSLYVVKTTWTCLLLYVRLLDGARLTWRVMRLALPDDTLSGGDAVDPAKVHCGLHLSS
ncbi:hypothetical protein DV702_08680 [Sporosarcina sp. PTS2304]|nr:hypothetical protein DV702_08680 [Sporosarcina sp. PTS2304]